jgi:hypothetical protein
MKMAKQGETLDMTEAPSEAFDRREVVVLTGETAQHCKQMLLPIIRTDAGGFFGFGEHDGPKLDNFESRFAELLPPRHPSPGRQSAPQQRQVFRCVGTVGTGQGSGVAGQGHERVEPALAGEKRCQEARLACDSLR